MEGLALSSSEWADIVKCLILFSFFPFLLLSSAPEIKNSLANVTAEIILSDEKNSQNAEHGKTIKESIKVFGSDQCSLLGCKAVNSP